MTLEQLSWHVDDVVKRELQGLKGVGQIDRIGGVTREIRVSLDPDRLLALGVTAADVNRQLRATTVDLAGGKGEVGGQEQSIRTLAGTHTIEDLEDTKIVLPGGREVRLDELGHGHRRAMRSRLPSPGSTARRRSSPSRSIAPRAPAIPTSPSASRSASRSSAKRIPEMTYQLVDDGVRNTYGNYRPPCRR